MLYVLLATALASLLGFRRGLRKGFVAGYAEGLAAAATAKRLEGYRAEPVVKRSPYIGDQNASPLAAPRRPQTARGKAESGHNGVVRLFTPLRTVPEPRPAMGRLVLLGVVAAFLGVYLGLSLRHIARSTAAPRPAVEAPQTDTADTPDDLGSIIHKAYGK